MNKQLQEAGIEWLTALLSLQGLKADVSAAMVDDAAGSSCWLTIAADELTEEQVQTLIGDHGNVLDSIQYLANTTLNLGHPQDEQQAFTIELAGYRQKRQAELKQIAMQAAEQAKNSGEEYEICDLSSAERRQVHHFLKEYEGLETFSRGKEPDRRLVVRLAES